METFYITFGQQHPLRDAYCEFTGTSYEAVRIEVFKIFGQKFSNIYQHSKFNFELYPLGKAGRTIKVV